MMPFGWPNRFQYNMPLERRVPLENVLVLRHDDAVEFTEQGGALLDVELAIVFRDDLVDARILEARDVAQTL
jgi:hypothetical protein